MRKLNPKQSNQMKMQFHKMPAACAAVAMAVAPSVCAEQGHDHAKKIAGPNGGRVINTVEPHLEFFVTKDRKVKITAANDDGKAIALGGQTVRVIGGSRSNPTRLSFTKEGDSLVSDKALPEGNDFPVVVQIKVTSDAKTVIDKFNLNLKDCPTCEHKEYACTCDHGEGSHEGHDH